MYTDRNTSVIAASGQGIVKLKDIKKQNKISPPGLEDGEDKEDIVFQRAAFQAVADLAGELAEGCNVCRLVSLLMEL